MATLFWISEQQGPLVFQTGNEGEENVWRSRDVVRERPHLQMQERLSSEQRTSSWHTPCLGVSCPALLRPTDTLNPVSFKNKNKKKIEGGKGGSAGHFLTRAQENERHLPCKQHQWLESRSRDAIQPKDPWKVMLRLWREKWKAMSLPCTLTPS